MAEPAPSAAHHSRLTWCEHHGRGELEQGDVRLVLRSRPPVLAHIAHLAELFYGAEGPRYVQDATAARRDLLPAESAECLRYLQQVDLDTRHAVGRKVAP